MARRNPQATVLPKPARGPGPNPADEDAELAEWLGERLRRLALGLAAALWTARAFWPGEPDLKAEAGTGLVWDLAVLLVGGIALASPLVGGTLRLRWSWTDAAVIALVGLVGFSSSQAYDRRVAINLAWDWAAVGVLYLLARNLPRTSAESKALAAALVATAVALSVYGLYQTGVELPAMRAQYLAHRAESLRLVGITPGTTAQFLYEKRLLGSNEPMSTFALTNSLAGFLVGPLVLLLASGWENLVRPEGRGSRWGALAAAALPGTAVLACLLLTKSRSAYVGLAVAAAVLAWRARRRASARLVGLAVLVGLIGVSALVFAGLASGRLDRQVLSESSKSLRYRAEYWQGAWRVITESPVVFFRGHGAGNFGAPYLRHKVATSSEEISDPHNMILEVWATAGFWAMLALGAGLGLALWSLLRARPTLEPNESEAVDGALRRQAGPSDPPLRSGWLLAMAGMGWVLVVFLGRLDPFQGDLFQRWLVLGGTWLWAIVFLLPLWRRLPLDPGGFGASALAIAVNLLAAGGIGFPPVALMLWTLIALGLNLEQERGSGRLRDAGGRVLTFALALFWAALLGIFWGAIDPHWRSEAAILEAEEALRARPPRFEEADRAYQRAAREDDYSSRPWLGLAYLKYEEWQARGARVDDVRWKGVPFAMAEAVKPPRNYKSWTLHRERARVTRDLLRQLGAQLKPGELLRYRANVVEATRRASRLYPSNAALHAQLADSSAEIGMFSDAVLEARKALDLDAATPHPDKKLPDGVRARLKRSLPGWEKAAPGTPSLAPEARKG